MKNETKNLDRLFSGDDNQKGNPANRGDRDNITLDYLLKS
jgi:hypothetical protein